MMRALVFLAVLLAAPHAWAAPSMIRLGYSGCAACHRSAQGSGLLTAYGKSVDEAQSQRAGELFAAPTRFDQDIRLLGRGAVGSEDALYRGRVLHRGALSAGRHSLAWTVAASTGSPAPGAAYDRSPEERSLDVPQALWEVRPSSALTLAVGRDRLPMGSNPTDAAVWVNTRTRRSVTDTPFQAKLFASTARGTVVPYVFATEANRYGAGLLGETFFARDMVAVGVGASSRRDGACDSADAQVFVRAGFGRFGVLGEHAITRRWNGDRFDQHVSLAQAYFAAQEWLVVTASAERLDVGAPHRERRWRTGVDASLRATSNVTVVLGVRREASPRPVWMHSLDINVKIPVAGSESSKR